MNKPVWHRLKVTSVNVSVMLYDDTTGQTFSASVPASRDDIFLFYDSLKRLMDEAKKKACETIPPEQGYNEALTEVYDL